MAGRNASQTEIAAVEARQIHHGLVQPAQSIDQQQPGDQAGAQTVDGTHVEERTADVTIGAAHQLDHLDLGAAVLDRTEEQTTEVQYIMCISYAVFCSKKKIQQT